MNLEKNNNKQLVTQIVIILLVSVVTSFIITNIVNHIIYSEIREKIEIEKAKQKQLMKEIKANNDELDRIYSEMLQLQTRMGKK